jgi:hypothetical protein
VLENTSAVVHQGTVRSREAWEVVHSGQQEEGHLACTWASVVVDSPKVREGSWVRDRNRQIGRCEDPRKPLEEYTALDALEAEDMRWLWLSKWT